VKYELGNDLPFVIDLTVITVFKLLPMVAEIETGLKVLALTVMIADFTLAPFELGVSCTLYWLFVELISLQVYIFL
jgi:hypothetical protein